MGAVVYTKEPAFPKEFIPDMREAVQKVGLKWDDFVLTDNTCKARESKLEEFEQDLVFVEGRAAASLQLQGNRVVKEIAKDVVAIEREIVKDVTAVEKEIEKDVVGIEKEIVKDVVGIEQEVEKDEAECQIKCGDEFSNEVVGDFTKCAVTDKKCVPQRG